MPTTTLTTILYPETVADTKDENCGGCTRVETTCIDRQSVLLFALRTIEILSTLMDKLFREIVCGGVDMLAETSKVSIAAEVLPLEMMVSLSRTIGEHDVSCVTIALSTDVPAVTRVIITVRLVVCMWIADILADIEALTDGN